MKKYDGKYFKTEGRLRRYKALYTLKNKLEQELEDYHKSARYMTIKCRLLQIENQKKELSEERRAVAERKLASAKKYLTGGSEAQYSRDSARWGARLRYRFLADSRNIRPEVFQTMRKLKLPKTSLTADEIEEFVDILIDVDFQNSDNEAYVKLERIDGDEELLRAEEEKLEDERDKKQDKLDRKILRIEDKMDELTSDPPEKERKRSEYDQQRAEEAKKREELEQRLKSRRVQSEMVKLLDLSYKLNNGYMNEVEA